MLDVDVTYYREEGPPEGGRGEVTRLALNEGSESLFVTLHVPDRRRRRGGEEEGRRRGEKKEGKRRRSGV